MTASFFYVSIGQLCVEVVDRQTTVATDTVSVTGSCVRIVDIVPSSVVVTTIVDPAGIDIVAVAYVVSTFAVSSCVAVCISIVSVVSVVSIVSIVSVVSVVSIVSIVSIVAVVAVVTA